MLQTIKKAIKLFIPTARIDLWRFERDLWRNMSPDMLNEGIENCQSGTYHIHEFKKDLNRFHVSFCEWAVLYDFPHLSTTEKHTFLSRYDAWAEYRKFVTPQIRELFYNKIKFLNYFKNKLHRSFLAPPAIITNEFIHQVETMIQSFDLIVKPLEGSLGIGVRKIRKGSIIDYERFAEEMRRDSLLIEECISGYEVLQQFNPQSLNTIRIITTFDGQIFDSFTRFGVGDTVVDNAHNGGIWCMNDIKNGIICTNGVNSKGKVFEKHPASGHSFKGTSLPKWDECCEKVKSMHSGIDLPFIGWDVCVNSTGQIEIIEANHAPDVDVLQYPYGIGIKSRFMQVISRFRKYLIETGKISNYPWGKY